MTEVCFYETRENTEDGGFHIAVTPKSYWDQYHHMSDDWHDCYEALDCFEMDCESMFSTSDHTLEEIEQIMAANNFERNADFSAFLAKCTAPE